MSSWVHSSLRWALLGVCLSGCTTEGPVGEPSTLGSDEPLRQKHAALTQAEQSCSLDPRVWSGLVPFDVCAGAEVFFNETFAGNGRTCGSCHPAGNNFTIDLPFVDTLDPSDPLFINESAEFDLAGLETTALRDRGLIKENVDGFEDNDNKFTMRAVPHLFSLSTSIERDPDDGTSSAFVERTGWSGDGVEGGALRDFANGAIIQHFPTDLSRTPNQSFRLASESELDQMLAFQLALGRTNELDLESVVLADPFAEQGRLDFLDPAVGRCNECHHNAGANSRASGLNTNFDTGIEIFSPGDLPRPSFDGVALFDGGFGGQGLVEPNIVAGVRQGTESEPNAFGDNTFNVPPLIEAADTAPFFHHNGSTTLAAAIAFYTDSAFNESPAAVALASELELGPVAFDGSVIINIQQFLRVLNIAFNLDLAEQRLDAAELLNVQYWNFREDVQRGLIELAVAEIEDAFALLSPPNVDAPPLHPELHQPVQDALAELALAVATAAPDQRLAATRQALTKLADVRAALGSNIDFELGPGNLMF